MVKVFIDMDQGFRWWPVMEDDPIHAYWHRDMTLEITNELMAEYKTAYEAYQAVQEKLEALYRIQNGYEPHPSQVAPEHKLLEKKDE
jgi:hypothetical protein